MLQKKRKTDKEMRGQIRRKERRGKGKEREGKGVREEERRGRGPE